MDSDLKYYLGAAVLGNVAGAVTGLLWLTLLITGLFAASYCYTDDVNKKARAKGKRCHSRRR